VLTRDGYPNGVPCWIDTEQPDPAAAADFYGRLFGWTMTDQMPPEAPGHYFSAEVDGHRVAAVGSATDDGAPAWNTYVWVDDADATAKQVEAAGGKVVAGPLDVFEAGRMAVCLDPSGAAFRLWQAGNHRGAQVANAPNSWVFSDLDTDDPKRSLDFYGKVFGWEADEVDVGGGRTWLLRQPGYGATLAKSDPDLYDRLVEYKAPPKYEDAVGWMNQQAAGDGPPRWKVTFAVDDTDAIAQRALELGGTALMGPTDLGPVRMAILRDPQGASFTVSKFDPH
jgi:predicted enzyme related to lactoylglutathione lyase